MIKIDVSDKIKAVCPGFSFAAIECDVQNTEYDRELWNEIDLLSSELKATYKMGDIKNRPTILATREVYKKLGKEPNRYRPSGEALTRRIIRGMELYQISTLVDIINLFSLKSGYSIGGFDADKIEGDLVLGVGEAEEEFEAIGRGLLNIENLPVYRDSVGGIGTPTSDEERTKISLDTKRLLMIINGYSGFEGLSETVDYSVKMLEKYASATNVEVWLYHP